MKNFLASSVLLLFLSGCVAITGTEIGKMTKLAPAQVLQMAPCGSEWRGFDINADEFADTYIIEYDPECMAEFAKVMKAQRKMRKKY